MRNRKKIKIISIDLQKDFSSKGGICYKSRSSVKFVKNILIPFFTKNNIKISEIISDYRQPRPGDRGDCCHPGEWGYESEIPQNIKSKDVWIKCMNSPIWVRENIGNLHKKAGMPYQDSDTFNKWLLKNIGKPESLDFVVLFGLTVDCCVLSVAQELNWRGYDVRILKEGVDSYSGDLKEKIYILENAPLNNWAKSISWISLKKNILDNN